MHRCIVWLLTAVLTSRVFRVVREQIYGRKVHRLRRHVEVVNGQSVVRYKRENSVRRESELRSFALIPLTMTVLWLVATIFDAWATLPPNISRTVSEPPNSTVFGIAAGERPPFIGCEYCEQQCAPCATCYDGWTHVYENRFDRCAASAGPCGYPFGALRHCSVQCAPFFALGRQGLHCIERSDDFSAFALVAHPDSTGSGREFCEYRDPSLPIVRGVDPWGTQRGRVPPSLYLPNGYTAGQGRRWPLVVFLNGRGTCGNLALWNFQLHGLRHWYGFLLLMPDSVRHAKGRFWCTPVDMLHAPDACGGSDDDAYIWSLVEEVRSDYEISDVIIMGWSNGAGLATTMACNHASDLLGAIVVAGGDAHTYAIPDHPSYSRGCQPDGPVHMLYLHDPNDLIVHYSNVVANVEHAANASGCDTSVCPAPQRRLDLVRHLEGVQRVGGDILNLGPRPRMETTLFAYRHCLPGGSAEMMVLMGYGSATSWYLSGQTSHGTILSFSVPAVGHILGFGQPNDQGEHFAFTKRALDWMWAKGGYHPSAAREGRHLTMFAARSLDHAGNLRCSIYTDYHDANKNFICVLIAVPLCGLAAVISLCFIQTHRVKQLRVQRDARKVQGMRDLRKAAKAGGLMRAGAVIAPAPRSITFHDVAPSAAQAEEMEAAEVGTALEIAGVCRASVRESLSLFESYFGHTDFGRFLLRANPSLGVVEVVEPAAHRSFFALLQRWTSTPEEAAVTRLQASWRALKARRQVKRWPAERADAS